MNWRIVLVSRRASSPRSPRHPPSPTGTALKNADDIVSGHPGLTYGDLVRQAIPIWGSMPTAIRVEGQLQEHRRAAWPAKSSRASRRNRRCWAPSRTSASWSIAQARRAARRPRRQGNCSGSRASRCSCCSMMMHAPKLLDAADVGIDKDTVFAEPGGAAAGAWRFGAGHLERARRARA